MPLAAPVIPPFRFAAVEQGLYRSAYPTIKNFRFLSRLRLRCILSLTPEQPVPELLQFCVDNSCECLHLQVPMATGDALTLEPPVALHVLQIIVNSNHSPCLMHDVDGGAVVSAAILCLRRLQDLHGPYVRNEFTRFVQTRTLIMLQEAEKLALQINKFELAVPSTAASSASSIAAAAIAPWLWSLPPHEHSCVKITVTGGGGNVGSAAGSSGAELPRGPAAKAAVGGGAGSVQVRALALETLDAAGVRR